MLKTKSKEATTEVAVATPKMDPRAAMKLVRSEVKKAVKENQRVDQMGYNGPDIARSQIALQDMLTKEQEKRRKAEGHIIQSKDMVEVISFNVAMMLDAATTTTQKQQRKIEHLSKVNQNYEAELDHLAVKVQMYADELATTNDKLAAALQTIKTMSEGTDLA